MTQGHITRRLRHLAAAAALSVAAFAAVPAHALSAVCEVLPTSDGFAALRASPSTSAPMIARMPVGHGVQMHFASSGNLVKSGGWVKVTNWPDGQFYNPGDPNYGRARTGWVVHRLVGECG